MTDLDTLRARYEQARAAYIDGVIERRDVPSVVEALDAAIVAFRADRTDRNASRLLLAAEDVVDEFARACWREGGSHG